MLFSNLSVLRDNFDCYGIETGNFTYAETIVNSGRFTVANPEQYGVKTFKLPVK